MAGVFITLKGFPEKVQQIADVIEDAFPGMLVWECSEDCGMTETIKIEGYEVPKMPPKLRVIA